MLFHTIILVLVLTTNEAKQDQSECKIVHELDFELECYLPTKYDHFDIDNVKHHEELDKVEIVSLTIGGETSPYEPPPDKNKISYPNWNQTRQMKYVSIYFYLKADPEELSLDLDEFQYISMDSFKGINLQEFQLSSNSPKVKFEADMLSDSNELQELEVTGASINVQQGWNKFENMSILELEGVGSIDLNWLPLRTLSILDLSLNEIKGITETVAKEMQLLNRLSLTVSNTQTLDWDFVNALAPNLHTLKLDGFALGNFNRSTIPLSSVIQYLTLSNSPNTEFIKQYSFSSKSYIYIELSGMKSLTRIEALAFTGSQNLENLTITDMVALTELTQPLGVYVSPKYVQFTNNPKLSHVSVNIFEEIFKYDSNSPTEVDVRGTEMDTTCPCEASYLAAMHKYQDVEIHSNCLDKWLAGKCKQDSCWTFMKPCNKTCQPHNGYTYTCTCQSNLVLLPDEHTCASSHSCVHKFDKEYNCSKYVAICYEIVDFLECHCESEMIWNGGNLECVTNHIIPFQTTMMTYKPISTNSTTITAHSLAPTVRHITNVTAETLHPPTQFVSGKTLVPPTEVIHSVTIGPSVTNHTITPHVISTNTTSSTITPATMSVNTTSSTSTPTTGGLTAVDKSVVGVSSFIFLLIIIVIVLLAGYWCYRKKKAARRLQGRPMVSPRPLDWTGG